MQKFAGKVLASIFWGQACILVIDYLPKSQTINAEYYPFLLVELKDILKKNGAGISQSVLILARQIPVSPGTFNLEETVLPGLPVS